jgi:hypothetical protein
MSHLNPEFCTLVGIAYRYIALQAFLDDSLGHVKPDPGPFLSIFGCKVRVKNPVNISSGIPQALSEMVAAVLLPSLNRLISIRGEATLRSVKASMALLSMMSSTWEYSFG